MQKKITLLITLCLLTLSVCTMLSVDTEAEASNSFSNEQLTGTLDFTFEEGKQAITDLNTNCKTPGSSDSVWNGNNNILTLNGVYVDSTADTGIILPEGATLVVNGENTVKITYTGDEMVYGIYSDLINSIEGNGKLTIEIQETRSTSSYTFGLGAVKNIGCDIAVSINSSDSEEAIVGILMDAHVPDATNNISDSKIETVGCNIAGCLNSSLIVDESNIDIKDSANEFGIFDFNGITIKDSDVSIEMDTSNETVGIRTIEDDDQYSITIDNSNLNVDAGKSFDAFNIDFVSCDNIEVSNDGMNWIVLEPPYEGIENYKYVKCEGSGDDPTNNSSEPSLLLPFFVLVFVVIFIWIVAESYKKL